MEDGTRLRSQAVVITAGTFLKGKCYIGRDEVVFAGRHLRQKEGYEAASIGLAESLEKLGFPKTRLKTGTPPRLDGTTIDYSQLPVELGDKEPQLFSYLHEFKDYSPTLPVKPCYMTKTTQEAHDVILRNLERSVEFEENDGEGNGPRYCPSLERKLKMFPN